MKLYLRPHKFVETSPPSPSLNLGEGEQKGSGQKKSQLYAVRRIYLYRIIKTKTAPNVSEHS